MFKILDFSDNELHFNFLCSGYTNDNIMRVLQGERIGTVFHKDAHLWTSIKEITAHEMAVAARDSSRRLQVYLRISSSFYNVKYELY
jgi:delta-1-pyrroline-5-carboxylate synthetase